MKMLNPTHPELLIAQVGKKAISCLQCRRTHWNHKR